MPQNKRILFTNELQEQALISQTLSHPARIDIMRLLNEHRFLICDELVSFLPYSQGGVSHHLEIMLKSKIIQRDEKFGAIGYQVDEIGLKRAKKCLQELISDL